MDARVTWQNSKKEHFSMDETTISQDEAAALSAKVYALVRACPAGRVTTYGWLSAAIGYPRGARMVGWIMNAVPKGSDVPAQRVLNSKGELTGSWAFGQKGRMRELLEAEGVAFTASGTVDLKRYSWNPNSDLAVEERERLLAGAHMDGDRVGEYLMQKLRDDPASPFRLNRPPE
jgi:methylated-DNA-protein-cysteine methyltransferase-like protein